MEHRRPSSQLLHHKKLELDEVMVEFDRIAKPGYGKSVRRDIDTPSHIAVVLQ